MSIHFNPPPNLLASFSLTLSWLFLPFRFSVRFAFNDVINLTKGSLNIFFVVTVMRGVSRFRPSLFGPPETPERRFRTGSGLGPLFVTRRATPSTWGCCFVTSYEWVGRHEIERKRERKRKKLCHANVWQKQKTGLYQAIQ